MKLKFGKYSSERRESGLFVDDQRHILVFNSMFVFSFAPQVLIDNGPDV